MTAQPYKPELRSIPLTRFDCPYRMNEPGNPIIDDACRFQVHGMKHTYCIGAMLDDDIPCPLGKRFAL
jgi:hypothetical protein